jgi:Hemerythrin HHE cation binding domain
LPPVATDLHGQLDDPFGQRWNVSQHLRDGFVHMHRNPEDAMLFDELGQTNPGITTVVDRLRGDHRAVSNHLDTVEGAVRALTDDDSHDVRQAVADALDVLNGHLLAHLEYEEENVAGSTRRLRDFSVRETQHQLDRSCLEPHGRRPETTGALWRRLREESLVPFTNMPAANDLVEDEGIPSCELLGGLAGREDRHRPFLLRVAERPVHEQHAAVVEFLAARSMGLEVGGRLREDVLSRVVEEYVLHGGSITGGSPAPV